MVRIPWLPGSTFCCWIILRVVKLFIKSNLNYALSNLSLFLLCSQKGWKMVYSVSQFKTPFTHWKMYQSPLVIFFFQSKEFWLFANKKSARSWSYKVHPWGVSQEISWKAFKNRNKSDINWGNCRVIWASASLGLVKCSVFCRRSNFKVKSGGCLVHLPNCLGELPLCCLFKG